LRDGNDGIQAIVAPFELDKHEYTFIDAVAGIEYTRHPAVGKWFHGETVHDDRCDTGRWKYLEKVSSFHNQDLQDLRIYRI
jgi:hypothetical protein